MHSDDVPRHCRRAMPLLLALALLGAAPPVSAGSGDDGGRVRAYFFGDSLMAGTGASPRRPVMARVAAARLHWTVDVDAWGGTGRTTTGRSPGYLQRLRRPGALPGRYESSSSKEARTTPASATPPASSACRSSARGRGSGAVAGRPSASSPTTGCTPTRPVTA